MKATDFEGLVLFASDDSIPARQARITWGKPGDRVGGICISDMTQCEPPESKHFAYSGGASYRAWQEAKPSEMKSLLLFVFADLTVNYGLPPKFVDAALQVIPEYRKAISEAANKIVNF